MEWKQPNVSLAIGWMGLKKREGDIVCHSCSHGINISKKENNKCLLCKKSAVKAD
jgi:hypothetical protein